MLLVDIGQLPSLKKGMSSEEEASKRRKTCRFIEEAGRRLKLPRVAISTAEVFFHRFYARHAFQEHDRFEVAVAALVLAAKTEEAPKKLNTVLQVCHGLKTKGQQMGRLSARPGDAGNSGVGEPSDPPPLDTKGEEFLKLKERVLLLERIILHTIGFELSIDHPYRFFVEQIKKLLQGRKLRYAKDSSSESLDPQAARKKMFNDLVQYSMSTANDSYQSSLCLQYGPRQIATACVFLACMFLGIEPENGDWKTTLFEGSSSSAQGGGPERDHDEDLEALVNICAQIGDLLSDKKSSERDAVRKLRTALKHLRNGAGAGAASGRSRSPLPPSPRPPPPPPPPGASPAKRRKVA